MKTLRHLISLAALTFALATLTFAAGKNANKNEGNFTLPDTVRVGSTELRPGEYKAEWKAESDGTVKVDILQHGKTVVTAQGKLKDLQQPAPYDAVITVPLKDNAKAINEIDFSKRKQALVLAE
ncbi:MAG: hypothetical protein WCA13_17185 [Terriglobales bacterium]